VAAVVVTARDARRFVGGLLIAAGAWFVVIYPNISGVPMPSTMVNLDQGLLPAYLYGCQFPVSGIVRNAEGPGLLSTGALLLLVATIAVALVFAYSAWVWRIALAERELEEARAPGTPSPPSPPSAPSPPSSPGTAPIPEA
jgi:hypothetical protein